MTPEGALDSLVTTDWLADNLGAHDLAVLDASRHLPAAKRDPRAEYEAAHIPGALFLDLATFTDPSSDTSSALPSAAQVAARIAELGLTPETRIVIYDDSAVKTSARARFALKRAGLANVAILDGGLGKWRDEGRPLEAGAANVEVAPVAALAGGGGVASKADMLANIGTPTRQVIDARGASRVFGSGIDPVHGGQNGRIPGALNVPYDTLYEADGTLKSPESLREAFEAAGVDLSRPVTTTCGSGVTACVLLFALERLGHGDGQLYDGSWQEWEADPATPKAQGPEASAA